MQSPTVLQSFVGGLGLAFPVHALLRFNGSVFGISGFVHRAVRGSNEAIASVVGLVLGGILVGTLENSGPEVLSIPLLHVAFSGFLVGLGTKLGNGCTSGHMICGLSRFSKRSIAAVATFCSIAAVTARIMHRDLPSVTSQFDWSLGPNGLLLTALPTIPLAVGYFVAPAKSTSSDLSNRPPPLRREIAALLTACAFALSLRLSNLTSPTRVLGFLMLPFHTSFDPSLVFLAMGALPASTVLYHLFRGNEKPKMGGEWTIPKAGEIDTRLLLGAAIFGVGWGLGGVCPGPALINLGRAAASGSIPALQQVGLWAASMAVGGYLA